MTRRARRTGLIVGGLVAVLLTVLLLVWPAWAYQWSWTGLGAFRGPVKNYKTPFDYYPSKTLWDLLQLVGIPLAVLVVGYGLNRTQQKRETDIATKNRAQDLSIAEKNRVQDLEIARNREQETVLAAYLEQMAALLLAKDRGLRTSQPEDEVRDVSRAQTLAALRRVEGSRKGAIVQFLHESRLIDKNNPIVVLRGGDLSEAALDRVSLSGAALSGANLRKANLRKADLSGADLREATLDGANLREVNLSGSDLSGSDLREATLRGANLSGANLRKADLRGANLSIANLSGADLSGADLRGANLSWANLRDANLSGAALVVADLSKATLRGANLSWAALVVADLSGADLSGADLSGANLSWANLSIANLRVATLRGVIGMTTEQLEEQGVLLEGATMPDGSIHL